MRKSAALAFIASLTGCAIPETATGPATNVELARTQYGVVHVKADSYAGIGYGLAYAHATDNVCLLADTIITTAGERAKYLGPGEGDKNVHSDFFARYAYDGAWSTDGFGRLSRDAQELIRGYVAGYNKYLAETGSAGLPEACRNAAWVRPMTIADMRRIFESKAVMPSSGQQAPTILAASPPERTALLDVVPAVTASVEPQSNYGSNGWAFGSEATGSRSGLLVGNPHFFWEGANRFYQIHLTLPGQFDVMGVTIAPSPFVQIGFNTDVAWTHTVSYASRTTYFELEIDPQDPTRYLLDGKSVPLHKATISVDVKQPDGSVVQRSHVFYESVHGPIVAVPAQKIAWTKARAYALADVNRGNFESMDTWLRYAKARRVDDLVAAASAPPALPWVNTIAADRYGDALYADLSRMPNVTAELLDRCRPSAPAAALAAQRIYVLDGSKAACNWTAAATPYLPAAALPVLKRKDYVANANDSYWLVNEALRLEAGSPMAGATAIAQGFRTRMQLAEFRRRFTGADGLQGKLISTESAQKILFSHRNYAAMLVGDDVVRMCRKEKSVTVGARIVELAPACKLLAAWDRRDDPQSRAALLFREFWTRASRIVNRDPNAYRVKFDAADPVGTPRQLDVDRADLATKLLQSLGEAILAIDDSGFALDARLADVQYAQRGPRRITVPGGDGGAGVLNAMFFAPLNRNGLTPIGGTSYLQLVKFDENGPIADGFLAYSQATDPASPYFADQNELYARLQSYRMPFTEADIRKDPGYRAIPLRDDPVLHRR